MADWKDILSNNDVPPENEELINYLQNHLTEEEKNAFEQKTLDSLFVNDAVEGLEHVARKENLQQYVQQLNKNLHQQLAAKKGKKQRRFFNEQPWVITTIIILLAICIIGYVMIRLHIISS